jgi:capsule polysaccharide export protein KpsE/RkpR
MTENTNENKPKNAFDLIDLIKILLNYKKFIIITMLTTGLVAAFFLYFVMEPIYLSKGTVKTTFKASSIGGLIGGGGLGDMVGLGDLAGGSGLKELALYENILSSRRNIEEIITKFNLNSEWQFKYMQDAVKYFREEVMEISKDKIAGTMDVGIYDKYPKRAQEMAEFMIFQLNKINTEMNVQNAKINREFIEARYNLLLKDLKTAEDSLKLYQDRYGLAPDISLKAASQTEIQIEAEIKSEELKLDLLKKILNPEESEVKLQEEKISALKKQLKEIQNQQYSYDNKLNLGGSPDVVMGFLRLQKQIEIQNKIQAFLLPLYEQAKIEEKKETPTVIILDNPNFPEKKTKPQRVKNIAIVLFFSFVFASVLAVLYNKIKSSQILKIIFPKEK